MDSLKGQPNSTSINAMINLSGAIGALKVIRDENNEVDSIIRSLESLVRELRKGNVIMLNLLENNNIPVAAPSEESLVTNITNTNSEDDTTYAEPEPEPEPTPVESSPSPSPRPRGRLFRGRMDPS